MKVTGEEERHVTGCRKTTVDQDDSLTATQTVTISAGDSVTLQTQNGAASITMSSDGKIMIKGATITLQSSGDTSVNATGKLNLYGHPLNHN